MISRPAAPASPFDPPSFSYQILTSPLALLIRALYHAFSLLQGPGVSRNSNHIRIVCISDTHTQKPPIPSGDVLIHAGDLTNAGTASEIQVQIDWLNSLPHGHKIAIAGNHDSYLDPRSRGRSDVNNTLDWGNIHYLQHSSVRLKVPGQGGNARVLNIYGAPQIPACGGKEFAFQYRREENAWTGTIPLDTDVLVTHTPPKWHLDLPVGLGCHFLLKEVWRVKPRVHVFGHVHAARGKATVLWDEGQKAYERLCGRKERWILWGGSLGIGWWLDVMRLAVYGILGLLWTKVWGAEMHATIMINAALIDWRSGKIGYEAQVIDV
ncbi:hypothetical protein MMC26_000676 [Xylographa opegraphella]|nr:hypothetical protein [Xylographa opegraphella]